MAKDTEIVQASADGKIATRPIGGAKARKFAAVEGLRLSADSEALARDLASSGLKGDAYRAAIIKTFRKS